MEREDLEWGVKLISKPIRHRPMLLAEVHIHKPTKSRKTPHVGLLFTGALGTPLHKSEANLWLNTLRALVDHAEEVVKEMKT